MKIDIAHIAKLANLPLQKEEEGKLATQLDATIAYIEELSQIDTSKVEGTNMVTQTKNVYREDEVDEFTTLSQDDALKNAKHKHNGLVLVPAILEEGDNA